MIARAGTVGWINGWLAGFGILAADRLSCVLVSSCLTDRSHPPTFPLSLHDALPISLYVRCTWESTVDVTAAAGCEHLVLLRCGVNCSHMSMSYAVLCLELAGVCCMEKEVSIVGVVGGMIWAAGGGGGGKCWVAVVGI